MTEEVPNIREVKMLPCSAGLFTHDNALALINCLDSFRKTLSGMARDNRIGFPPRVTRIGEDCVYNHPFESDPFLITGPTGN
jgi:hypothetical protein